MSNDTTSKACRRCGKEQPIAAYALQHTAPDGHRAECRKCRAESDRAYLLGRRFGITVEDYERMLNQQGGGCALCKADVPGGRWTRFHVDHDHDSGRVRGLLCYGCNTALGRLGDTPEAMARVYAYVAAKQAA